MLPRKIRTDITGFPAEYERRVRKEDAAWNRFTAVVSAGTGVVVSGGLFWGWPAGVAATAGAVLLYLTTVGAAGVLDRRWRAGRVRIVPYFQAPVPGEDTFFAGHALARACRHLDEAAVHARLVPLSAFGFSDEFHGEQPRWHSPAEALRTIDHLLAKLYEDPFLVRDAECVAADLAPIRVRLAEAERLGVSFCFHLRMDAAYSPQEFDIRAGHY